MRIAVNAIGNHAYYLNFDLIVEFYFLRKKEDEYISLSYTTTLGEDNWESIKISEEEKNKILNKLGL